MNTKMLDAMLVLRQAMIESNNKSLCVIMDACGLSIDDGTATMLIKEGWGELEYDGSDLVPFGFHMTYQDIPIYKWFSFESIHEFHLADYLPARGLVAYAAWRLAKEEPETEKKESEQ